MILRNAAHSPCVEHDESHKRIDFLILSLVGVETVLCLAKVSRHTRDRALSFIAETMRIESDLENYFEPCEVKIFRTLQYKTGLIISGSFALKFVTGRKFEGNTDLDLYVECPNAFKVLHWLSSIGYVMGRRWIRPCALPPDENEEYPGIDSCLEAVLDHERNGKKVQLMVIRGIPLDIVLQYHSTCVMTIITHNKCYSLYPKGTLVDRKSLVISRQGKAYGHSEHALQKYRDRGWSIIYHPTAEDMITFPAGCRSICDSQAWVIPLTPTNCLEESPLEGFRWILKEVVLKTGAYEHTCSVMSSLSLKQSFTFNN
ncbi:hypothetical protein BJ165DRAFT_1456362 [Panaeolus papilionaceus]|nr:hypothetical protein BJ165DRAFT_1456362 [Panaeolus papilionaceus]